MEGVHRSHPAVVPSGVLSPPSPLLPACLRLGPKPQNPTVTARHWALGWQLALHSASLDLGTEGTWQEHPPAPQSQRKEKGPSMGSQAGPTRRRPGTATPQRAPGSNNRGSPGAPHSQTSPLSSGVPPGPSPPAAAPPRAPRPAARSHHLHRGYTLPSSEAREQRPVLG